MSQIFWFLVYAIVAIIAVPFIIAVVVLAILLINYFLSLIEKFSVVRITFIWDTCKFIELFDDSFIFASNGKNVYFITYDDRGREIYNELYSGDLAWNGEKKSKRRLVKFIKSKFIIRALLWSIIIAPMGVFLIYDMLISYYELIGEYREKRLLGAISSFFLIGLFQWVPYRIFPSFSGLLINAFQK